MGDEALLRRLIVIGRDDQQRIGADLFGMLGKLDGFAGIVRACAGDDRHALVGRFDAQFDDPFMLGMGKRRRFTGGADRHQAAGPLGDLPIHMGGKGLLVDGAAFGEGRDECGNGSLEHAVKLLQADIHASAAFLGYKARTLLGG